MLGLIWSLAVAGVVARLWLNGLPPPLVVTLYVAMGWAVVMAIQPLGPRPWAGAAWSCWWPVGWPTRWGWCFTNWRSRPYSHAIWHLFVLAGGACFFAVLWFVIPACGGRAEPAQPPHRPGSPPSASSAHHEGSAGRDEVAAAGTFRGLASGRRACFSCGFHFVEAGLQIGHLLFSWRPWVGQPTPNSSCGAVSRRLSSYMSMMLWHSVRDRPRRLAAASASGACGRGCCTGAPARLGPVRSGTQRTMSS